MSVLTLSSSLTPPLSPRAVDFSVASDGVASSHNEYAARIDPAAADEWSSSSDGCDAQTFDQVRRAIGLLTYLA